MVHMLMTAPIWVGSPPVRPAPRKGSGPAEVEWSLNEVTKIKVTPVTGTYEDVPIDVRTMVTFIYSIESHDELVRQSPQQKGLLSLFADDNTRDIYRGVSSSSFYVRFC